jgi:SAM-dependent methyltransferase
MHHLINEIFGDLPRQGPGDRASTRRALAMVCGLPPEPDILDVGCGTGGQTLDLAGLTPGRITAVDNQAPFLVRLRDLVRSRTLRAKVRPVVGDMAALPFADASFDLIWSEGAAYSMGFEAALRSWRPFLRPGGSLVVSEAAWFRADPPSELREFWEREYPGMRLETEFAPIIEVTGYEPVGRFRLPDGSWWTDLYDPLEAMLGRLRRRHRGDAEAEAEAFLDSLQVEVGMHRRYADHYGYVFLVMKKAG